MSEIPVLTGHTKQGCNGRAHKMCACPCRQCSLGYHCGNHGGGCHQACQQRQRTDRAFRRFECYRPDEAERLGLAPLQPSGLRFEGVVFTDGTCVIRWTGKIKSTSVFPTLAALMRTHVHPEFGAFIRWLDDPPEPGE